MFKQWGSRYLAATRRRFVEQSRGGGEWPPLAESTERQRRGEGEQAAILRDTSTLFSALSVGAPGNEFQRSKSGIRVGFGGQARHPEGGASIHDIALFHQTGAGRLPVREILVMPDARLRQQMIRDGQRQMRRLMAQAERRT